MGLPGIFWFTFPNVVCFFVFAPLALRLRQLNPQGYTLPEFIDKRFGGHRGVHIAFLCLFFGYQLAAIVSNSVAGGYLLHELSGISVKLAIVAMVVVALSYSMWSGLKASVLTDIVQMTMVLGLALIMVPLCVIAAGGMQSVMTGLGGVDGTHGSIFDPWIAFSMGIPMTITLLSGPICHQMFFQRAMAVKEENVVKTFVYGGLIFGMVPITLSLLGFLAAAQVAGGTMTVSDPQMVGAATIGHFLPKVALYAFAFMAFAGLCSTLDSALCAASSLGSVDVFKRYMKPEASDGQILRAARISMLCVAMLQTIVALLEPKILWVFFISGALAAAGFFPTILSLYWERVEASGVLMAVAASLLFGMPLAVYANLTDNPCLNVVATIVSVMLGLIVCAVSTIRKKLGFSFAAMTVACSSDAYKG